MASLQPKDIQGRPCTASGTVTSSITLTKLDVTGPITDKMPNCVIEEIALSSGIPKQPRASMAAAIRTSVFSSVAAPYKDADLARIAYLINPSASWNTRELVDAFNFLQLFMTSSPRCSTSPLFEIPSDFISGLPSPLQPRAVGACILYRICCAHRYEVKQTTTIYEMERVVRRLRAGTEKLIESIKSGVNIEGLDREITSSEGADGKKASPKKIVMVDKYGWESPPFSIERTPLPQAPAEALTGCFCLTAALDQGILYCNKHHLCQKMAEVGDAKAIPPKYSRDGLTQSVLSDLYVKNTSVEELRRKRVPATHHEAVCLAALVHKIDISMASDPLAEYGALEKAWRGATSYSSIYLNDYTPLDEKMRVRWINNPRIFSLSHSFIAMFPENYYRATNLRDLAMDEGWTVGDLMAMGSRDALWESSLIDTFHEGWLPGITNTVTPIALDDIRDVDPNLIICYGQRDGKVTATTYEELTNLFRSSKNFSNPFEKATSFSKRDIFKLRRICLASLPSSLKMFQPALRAVVDKAKKDLLRAIVDVEFFSSSCYLKASPLITIMNKSKQNRDMIRELVEGLLNMAMFMRGWDGKSALPIESAPVPASRMDEVSNNASAATSDLLAAALKADEKCLDGKIGTQFLALPLVTYLHPDFVVSSSDDDGKTIKERIDITRMKDREKNAASCIRLSSNWFASSAHRYATIFGFSEPFNITKMARIV